MEVSKAISDPEPGSLMLDKKTSFESQQTTRVIITFDSNDPENPNNWSKVCGSHINKGLQVLTAVRPRRDL
jgi:hypothetical protein